MKSKRIFTLGKVLIAAGIIHLFRKIDAHFCFGGICDNIWLIITISVALILTGLTIDFYTKKSPEV